MKSYPRSPKVPAVLEDANEVIGVTRPNRSRKDHGTTDFLNLTNPKPPILPTGEMVTANTQEIANGTNSQSEELYPPQGTRDQRTPNAGSGRGADPTSGGGF